MPLSRLSIALSAALLVGLFLSATAHAQTAAVNAQAAPPQLRIKVVKWDFADTQHTMGAAQKKLLIDAIHPSVGKSMTESEIDTLADSLTNLLRSPPEEFNIVAYPLAYVLVTPDAFDQGTQTGELTITVLEGKVGKVALNNKSNNPTITASKMLTRAMCASLDPANCKGLPITSSVLDRAVLMLRELPNTVIDVPVFSKGDALGEGDVTIPMRDAGAPTTLTVGFDNSGSPATGRTRLNLGFESANALGHAETLYVNTMISNQHLRTYSVGGDVIFNSYGTKMGLGASRLNLALSGVTGQTVTNGESWSVYLRQPIMRRLDASNSFLLSYVQGRSHTDYLNRLFSVDGNSFKTVAGFSGHFGPAVNLRDPRNTSNAWSMLLTNGTINLDPQNVAADAAGAQTQGNYSKLSYSFVRQQVLNSSGTWSLSGSITGQVVNKNMDSGEKITLGGPSAVRAYPVGELGSDIGNVANLDLKRHFDGVGGGRLSVGVFTDYARGQLLQRNYAASTLSDAANKVSINGTGLGLAWATRITHNRSWSMSASYARQGGRLATAEIDNSRSRLYVNAQTTF